MNNPVARYKYSIAGFIFLLFISPVRADHVPGHSTLELGVGLVSLTIPDYRGSSEYQSLVLPFPYLKYRGHRLRVDDGIEGRFFDTPDLLLSISGNGSLPSSEDNKTREGMDELDVTVELGPSLEYRIRYDDHSSLWLELPLRYAMTINSELDSIGHVFHPRLAWRKPALDKEDWKLRVAGGPLYADSTYHGYYYNVKDSESSSTRPAYQADSGYSGFRTDFSFSRRIDTFWFGGFIRYDSLNDSEIEDSPLVTEKTNWLAGVSFAWVISEN